MSSIIVKVPRATVQTLLASLNSMSKISPVFKLLDCADVKDTVNSPSSSSAVANGKSVNTLAGFASFKFPATVGLLISISISQSSITKGSLLSSVTYTLNDAVSPLTTVHATDLGSNGNNESTINGIENSTVFDNFLASEFRSMRYIISIKKTSGGANKYYATEMNILVDGADVSVSEYATMDNDGNIGTISVSRAGDTVSLTVLPVGGQTPITLRYMRMGLKA